VKYSVVTKTRRTSSNPAGGSCMGSAPAAGCWWAVGSVLVEASEVVVAATTSGTRVGRGILIMSRDGDDIVTSR
jgi:hypothetical protein